MALQSSEVLPDNTLEEFRIEFNKLVTDVSGLSLGNTFTSQLIFEGDTDNAFETVFLITDPTADKVITFPDTTGTVLLDSASIDLTGNLTTSGIIKTDDTTAATSTTDGSLQTDGGLSVVLDAVIGDDLLLLSDAAVLSFGADSEVTLTHVHNDGLLLNTDMQLQFRDSAINIRSDADGDLDINADDEIELNSTLIDINGNVDISGTALVTGVLTTTATQVTTGGITSGSNIVSDTDSTDDLGTTGVRWANLFVDAITATDQITATGFTGTLDGILGSGAAAAATVTTLNTSGVVNLNLTTDSTSSTSGALIIDGGVGVAKKLFVGTDFDVSGNSVIDGTALVTGVLTSTATQVATGGITSGSNIVSDTDSTDDLGTTSVRWANLFVDAITTTGEITATGFTGTLDGILGSGAAAAATVTTLTGTTITAQTAFVPDASDGAALGTTALEFSDLFLADGAVINLGDDQDVTITHVADTGIALNSKDIAGVTSINSGQIGGRRNIVINGEMKVAQRATSAAGKTGGTSGYFALDRWKLQDGTIGTAGRCTIAQIADGPAGIANCLKISATTAAPSIAAGEALILQTRFEGQDLQQLKKGTATAEQVTVSFYVKGNAAALYVCELHDVDNGRNNTQSFAVTTDWNRIELTFAADTSDPLDDDTAVSLSLNFWLHSGSNYSGGTFASNTWADITLANTTAVADRTSIYDSTDRTFFLTGVQMEIGSTATDFESRSFSEELALCQRYFQKTYDYDVAIGTNTIIGTHASGGNDVSPTTSYIGINTAKFTSQMRDNPTIVVYDTVGNSGKSTRFQYGVAETDDQAVTVANIGTTGFNGYSASAANLSGVRIHYTATSEL
jgi:hypothetical protein